MAKILLKTTIPHNPDDWHIGRFSLLAEHLRREGHEVATADRSVTASGDDTDLVRLPGGGFDQLWLFAVDVDDALTSADCEAVTAFRASGGGVLLTRDHEDLGACLTRLGVIGKAHHFHTVNPEPDEGRRCRDDAVTLDVSWPNYHSGANGDAQRITIVGPVHPVLKRADGAPIEYLPAHPHEGAVGVPGEAKSFARSIASGVSKTTGAVFNLAVAFEDGPEPGRALASSTFHHFCDYNLDPAAGCPSFVSEPPGSGMRDNPDALPDAYRYFTNIASWLTPPPRA